MYWINGFQKFLVNTSWYKESSGKKCSVYYWSGWIEKIGKDDVFLPKNLTHFQNQEFGTQLENFEEDMLPGQYACLQLFIEIFAMKKS